MKICPGNPDLAKSDTNIGRLHGERRFVLLLRATLFRHQSALYLSQIDSGRQDSR